MQDAVWEVIAQTMHKFKGIEATPEHRKAIERLCRIEEFDGGAFVIRANEIDLFVVPDKRGRWATRGLLDRVVGGVIREYGSAQCAINENNGPSLRLAKRLGFQEVGREGSNIRLELKTWAAS